MGKLISQEVFDTLVKNYEELHGAEESFVKYSTIPFESIGVTHKNENAVGFRAYNGYDGQRTRTLLVIIDDEGNELDPSEDNSNKDNLASRKPKWKAYDDPGPTCPPSC